MTKLTYDSCGFFEDGSSEDTIAFKIQYSFPNESAVIKHEPEDYVQEIEGEIIQRRVSDSDEKDTKIGRIKGRQVLVAQANEDGESLFDVFDSVDDDLLECYQGLFDLDTEDYREELEIHGDSDVLAIQWLEILPAYRGNNVGLLAMRDFVTRFGGGCGVAVIHPFPLQCRERSVEDDAKKPAEMRMGYADMSKDEAASIKKLRGYYARLGFVPVLGREKLMVLDLTLRNPSVKELLRAKPRSRRKAAR